MQLKYSYVAHCINKQTQFSCCQKLVLPPFSHIFCGTLTSAFLSSLLFLSDKLVSQLLLHRFTNLSLSSKLNYCAPSRGRGRAESIIILEDWDINVTLSVDFINTFEITTDKKKKNVMGPRSLLRLWL